MNEKTNFLSSSKCLSPWYGHHNRALPSISLFLSPSLTFSLSLSPSLSLTHTRTHIDTPTHQQYLSLSSHLRSFSGKQSHSPNHSYTFYITFFSLLRKHSFSLTYFALAQNLQFSHTVSLIPAHSTTHSFSPLLSLTQTYSNTFFLYHTNAHFFLSCAHPNKSKGHPG